MHVNYLSTPNDYPLDTYSELGGSIDISAMACSGCFIVPETATVTPPVFALFLPGLPDPLPAA